MTDEDAKTVIVERPGQFRLTYESVLDRKIIHCDVYRWTPSIRRRFFYDFQYWFHQDNLGHPVYVARYPHQDRKFDKFIRMHGFEPLAKDIRDYWGRPCDLWVKFK